MAERQGKVPSFTGAEFMADDDLQMWRGEVLKEFFRQCSDAFGELTGPILGQLRELQHLALLAADDACFHEELLVRYAVRERSVSLAVFSCFKRDSEGRMVHRVTASHLRLCEDDYLPDLQPFRDAFLEWLGRYNLAVDWVADALLDLLRDYQRHPALYRDGFEADRDRAGWVVNSPEFRFEYRGFELTGEYLASYRKGLEDAFRAALDRHSEAIEAQAKEHGLARANDVSFEHCVWLVEYLCRGRKYSEIAKSQRAQRSEKAVQSGVKRLAERLGLKLPDRKGRRKSCK